LHQPLQMNVGHQLLLGLNWIKTNVIWAPIISQTLRLSVDTTVDLMSIPTPSLME